MEGRSRNDPRQIANMFEGGYRGDAVVGLTGGDIANVCIDIPNPSEQLRVSIQGFKWFNYVIRSARRFIEQLVESTRSYLEGALAPGGGDDIHGYLPVQPSFHFLGQR